jgi:hypothetical protein
MNERRTAQYPEETDQFIDTEEGVRKGLTLITTKSSMDIEIMCRKGYSLQKITQATRLSRRTVKMYLENVRLPKYFANKKRVRVPEPLMRSIDAYVDDNAPASWIFKNAHNWGYRGDYTPVRIAVSASRGNGHSSSLSQGAFPDPDLIKTTKQCS